jgi:hypothetical protein
MPIDEAVWLDPNGVICAGLGRQAWRPAVARGGGGVADSV